MYCKDCKYFKSALYSSGGELIENNNKMGLCFNEKINSDYIYSWEERKGEFKCEDGVSSTSDDDRSVLYIGKYFGCINFNKK